MALDSVPDAAPREKRQRISSDNDDPLPTFLILKRSEGDFGKVSPFLISKLLKAVSGDPKSVRKIREGLLIETKSNYQSEKLLALKSLGEFDVSVIAHSTLNTSKGVVYSRDLMNCQTEEILAELKSQGVYEVRRITTKKNGVVENTPSLILSFKSRDVPKYIYAAMYRLPVRVYIPNPMRCFNCQRFGHSSTRCTSVKICVCGKPTHDGTDCSNAKCINCEGNHPSSSRNCPKFKFEYSVIEYKTLNKCSFPEARDYVSKLSPSLTTSYARAATKPVSNPAVNVSDIVALLIPEMTTLIKTLFAEFAMMMNPQAQFKTPTVTTTQLSEKSNAIPTNKPSTENKTPATLANISNIRTTKIPSTGHKTPVPSPSNISVEQISHHDISDESDGSTEGKKKGRGWIKGRSRSKHS